MKTRTLRAALLSAVLVSFAAAAPPSVQDHAKLAQYFNQRAVQSDVAAQDHEEMIAAYRSNRNPTTQAIKAPGGVGTIEHCQALSRRVPARDGEEVPRTRRQPTNHGEGRRQIT